MVNKILLIISLLFLQIISNAQNLGGSATYNFLKLPSSPLLSALGGTNVAIINKDANLVQQNPAMLKPFMSNSLGINNNFMYDGIKNIFVNYTKHQQKIKTTFNGSINYINYGKNNLTDATGNNLGNFIANDFVIQVTASKKYLKKWDYGGTLKYIGSQYGIYKSSGIAFDFGINYFDSSKLLKAGMVFKNIGTHLKSYGDAKEPLPFTVELGIAKKLENAPLQFMLTITNAHQFDIRYADTSFENEINSTIKNGKFTIDKIFRHFILAAQLYPSKNTEFTLAYNYLRRKELGLYNIGNGLTGFSCGFGLLFNSYQIRYGRAYYQNSKAYNHFGISINFNALHF